ncbi:hypothetical protein [Sorangium sp. So ce131]|uniref:hypothetical protein n=1 Tax=Sorangium sp. So ce131 TaxID=3133282 RepID=UPI003F61420E
MLYWETRFLRIDWDEELRCVCTAWKDAYADGNEYRTALDKVLDLVTLKRASRLLGDGRRMKVISESDQEWVESSWMPRSAQAGLRRSALLLPRSALAQLSVHSILARYTLYEGRSVEVINAYFDDMSKAKEWLCKQPGGAPAGDPGAAGARRGAREPGR